MGGSFGAWLLVIAQSADFGTALEFNDSFRFPRPHLFTTPSYFDQSFEILINMSSTEPLLQCTCVYHFFSDN
jgi:hypothetical protein